MKAIEAPTAAAGDESEEFKGQVEEGGPGDENSAAPTLVALHAAKFGQPWGGVERGAWHIPQFDLGSLGLYGTVVPRAPVGTPCCKFLAKIAKIR